MTLLKLFGIWTIRFIDSQSPSPAANGFVLADRLRQAGEPYVTVAQIVNKAAWLISWGRYEAAHRKLVEAEERLCEQCGRSGLGLEISALAITIGAALSSPRIVNRRKG